MFFIKLTLLYLVIYGILFLSGWGLCELICKGKNEKYKVLLSPIIGLIPISIVPMYLSFLGIKTSLSGWFTFVFFAALSLYYLIKHPGNLKKQSLSPVLFLFIIIGALPSFSIIYKAGYLTSTLQSYSAAVIYLSEFFSSHSALGTVSLDFDKPFTNMLSEIFKITPFYSVLFLIATISSILDQSPYAIYLVLSGIIGSFLPVSTYIACIEGFKVEKKVALLIAFLVSINISFFFWPLIGHLPYISGIVYLILALGFLPRMLVCSDKVDLLFYSVLMAGIVSNYFNLMPYIVGIALIYVLCRREPAQIIRKSIMNTGIIVAITFIITPFVFIFLGRLSMEFITITSQYTDNIPRYPYLEELLGFGQHFSMNHNGLKSYLILSVAIGFVPLICAGLYDRLKSRDTLFLSISGFIFALGFYFFLTGLRYHFYKNSIIGVFILLVALVTGANWVYKNIDLKIMKVSVPLLLLLLILFDLRAYSRTVLFSSDPLVTKPLIDLENISNLVPGHKRILVSSANPTEEIWAAYFLKNSKIKLKGLIEPWGFWIFSPFSGQANLNFFYDHTKDEIDYTLSTKSRYQAEIAGINYGEIAYENEGYILSKKIPNPFLYKGWYAAEKDAKSTFRWTQKKSSFFFKKPEGEAEIYINGTVPDVFRKSIEISFKINGTLIDKFFAEGASDFNKHYMLNRYPLKKSQNIFAISLSKVFVPDDLWNSGDLRELGIRINGIKIIPLDKS